MTFVVLMILGLGLGLGWLMPGQIELIGLAGLVAGSGQLIATRIWPPARPAYIDPEKRQQATTTSTYAIAALLAFAGGGAAFAAWNAPGYFVLARSWGFYLAGLGIGMAIVLAVSARRSCEDYNRWIGSMPPRTPLDF